MTYTHNPIGYVVLSSENPDHDLERWKRARPHAMTFTQNTFGLVKRCLDGIPELQVAILRTVLNGEEEKELHKTGARGAENMVNAFIALCDHEGLDRNRCYLQLWNEPDLTTEREAKLNWTVYAMRLARERGVRVSALGIGMATLTADDWQSGDFNLLLHECADGYHIFNTHSYGSVILPAGAAGRYPDMYLNKDMAQQANWPSPYDTQEGSRTGNWYIGREFDIIAQCNVLGIPYPRIIIGECGIDRMQDLEWAELSTKQFVNIYDILEKRYMRVEARDGKLVTLKVPWPHWGMRGWHTVEWVHADYYPDWLPAKTYVEMLKWMCWMYDNQVAGGRPFVEAIQVFAHCPGMQDWATAWGMDISDSDHWYALVAEYGDSIVDPTPDPEPTPDPDPLPDDMPESEPWMVMLMLFICACVLGAIIYSSLVAPHIQYVAMLEVNPVEELLNQLFAIPALAPITFSGAIILYLVEIGKRLKAAYAPDILPWLTPEFMVVFWVVFFMGAFGIAQQYAYDNIFKQVAEVVTQLVKVLGPYVLGMIGTQVAVAAAHNGIRKVNVSGFDQ